MVAYPSLFKVKIVFQDEGIIILQDLLNNNPTNIKLIDINLSKSIQPNMLLFTRIIPFKDFKITSGVNFAFRHNIQESLIKEYQSLAEKIPYNNSKMKRFISFFKLNRKYGIFVFSRNV